MRLQHRANSHDTKGRATSSRKFIFPCLTHIVNMPPQQLNAAAIADDDIPVVSVSNVHAAAAQKAGELLQNIHSAERKDAARHVAQHISAHGLASLEEFAVVSSLQDAMNKQGKTGGDSREGACLTVTALINELGAPIIPYMLPLLSTIIELMGDKVRPVQIAAQEAGDAFIATLPPNAVRSAMPALLARNTRWQSNLFRMEAIQKLVKVAPLQVQMSFANATIFLVWFFVTQIAAPDLCIVLHAKPSLVMHAQINRCMGELVPAMSEAMWDLKPEVKAAAKAAMEATCNAVDNRYVPSLSNRPFSQPWICRTQYLWFCLTASSRVCARFAELTRSMCTRVQGYQAVHPQPDQVDRDAQGRSGDRPPAVCRAVRPVRRVRCPFNHVPTFGMHQPAMSTCSLASMHATDGSFYVDVVLVLSCVQCCSGAWSWRARDCDQASVRPYH
jgi:hypothetical protein